MKPLVLERHWQYHRHCYEPSSHRLSHPQVWKTKEWAQQSVQPLALRRLSPFSSHCDELAVSASALKGRHQGAFASYE